MKILVIDDQSIANLILRKLIESKRPQCEVLEFTQAQEALDVLEETDPFLIFLDLNMPQMNGWQFLEEMNQRGLHYPVAILTSSTSNLDSKKAEQFPQVKQFFVKPLSLNYLHQFLDEIEIPVES